MEIIIAVHPISIALFASSTDITPFNAKGFEFDLNNVSFPLPDGVHTASAVKVKVTSLENLIDMYYKSIGHNSTLIMGLTPDPSGLIPEPDVKRLKEWGDEIKRRFKNPIATMSGEGEVLDLRLAKATKINHIILQEDISNGERVRNYKLEVFINNQWKEVGRGECIGHKRIQIIETVETSRIRLKIF